MSVRIGIFVVAALLLGAHFLRGGNFPLVALCLATPLLFMHRRRRSLIVLQLAAYCATGTWVWTALRLIESRRQFGQPWTAAAIILGAVALFTLAAGLLLNSLGLRERYPGDVSQTGTWISLNDFPEHPMHTSVGANEARTMLPELLRGVLAGNRYTITLHGRPIAELGPASTRYDGAADAVERMKQFMREAPLRGTDIKALIGEGRR